MSNGSGDIEIASLLHAIDQAYDHAAWHGPNLRGSLRGLTPTQAAWRPAPGRHNIWELVVHAASWKYALRRRIVCDKRGSFAERGSNWFRRADSADETAWRQDLALLEEEHRRLRDAIEALDSKQLHKRRSVKGRPLIDHALGIAFHDIYHAGQIQLLKRMQKGRAKQT